MLYVFRQHGVNLPRYSGHQFQAGVKVTSGSLAPGDAVFFGSPIHHVGMYMGGGYYIHAPRTGDFVKISKLADRSDFAGGRRYAWNYRVGAPVNAVKSTSDALSSVKR
jgi:cell wall-associated NlpC family hydrolase